MCQLVCAAFCRDIIDDYVDHDNEETLTICEQRYAEVHGHFVMLLFL